MEKITGIESSPEVSHKDIVDRLNRLVQSERDYRMLLEHGKNFVGEQVLKYGEYDLLAMPEFQSIFTVTESESIFRGANTPELPESLKLDLLHQIDEFIASIEGASSLSVDED